MLKNKRQSFSQSIFTLMISQVIIKIFGIIYKLYLTNKSGFGDSGNAIYSGAFQIYMLVLTIGCVRNSKCSCKTNIRKGWSRRL